MQFTKLAHVLTIVMDNHLTSARNMAPSPHTATLLSHLALISSPLTNILHTAIVHRLVTPTILSHNSMEILVTALGKDTHLQSLNHTVHLTHSLHDLRIPCNNRNRNLCPIHNLIHSLSLSRNLNNSFHPNLNRSSNIIPPQLRLNR